MISNSLKVLVIFGFYNLKKLLTIFVLNGPDNKKYS